MKNNGMPLRIWATPMDPEFEGGSYCDGDIRPLAPNKDAWSYISADTLAAIVDAYDREQPLRQADMHRDTCACLRCAVDMVR